MKSYVTWIHVRSATDTSDAGRWIHLPKPVVAGSWNLTQSSVRPWVPAGTYVDRVSNTEPAGV